MLSLPPRAKESVNHPPGHMQIMARLSSDVSTPNTLHSHICILPSQCYRYQPYRGNFSYKHRALVHNQASEHPRFSSCGTLFLDLASIFVTTNRNFLRRCQEFLFPSPIRAFISLCSPSFLDSDASSPKNVQLGETTVSRATAFPHARAVSHPA